MLLDFSELVKKYNLQINGVIQCGAHWGQEFSEYQKNGIDKIVFIEPCKKAFDKLKEQFGGNFDIILINHACGEEQKEATMFTGDNTVNFGMSNSLLRPTKHLQLHPTVEFPDTEKVTMIRMDDLRLVEDCYNMLVMDCQGYEGNILKGGLETLKKIDYVYTEINFDEVYENCTQAAELDDILHEFERVETGTKVGGMWSDCLYIRKSIFNGAN